MTLPQYEVQFEKNKACVLIPTYNNAQTIASVLESILQYTSHVIVVNDGSTDNTQAILQQFPQLYIVSYDQNQGKGFALRTGFREAWNKGYENAITIDSDGQHYASDLLVFLEESEKSPGVLLVGARNMDQENVPTKSSFGNRFSNFWFWVNTGTQLPDTQSGYRLYPLKKIANKKYFTRKYEFEIEVMVRASWSGVLVKSVPVSVYYPSPEERISHFRPFKDFTRISILNTFLVLVALLWVKPRDLFMSLLKKEGWKQLWRSLFQHPEESNHKKATSVGFGFFMGIVPVWGFQLAIGIPLSILFKMNKALFLLAANISIFPLTPFIWMLSLATGKIILGYDEWSLDWRTLTLDRVKEEGIAFFLGGTVLAIATAIIGYVVSYIVLLWLRRNRKAPFNN
ncbi:MAG TPA: DUF2062 domain-containing protein [Flavipsychrobacter sp.]|nr:DUF2062 domain-containing protein [Flavipsychrobacter sp.]